MLMITGAYHPEISSGGTQCQALARALRGRAAVEVLTTAVDRSLPPEAIVDGVPVTRVAVDVGSLVSKLRATRRMLVALGRLLRRSDLVHLHGVSTKNVLVTVAARLFGKPIVLSLHTAGFDEPPAIRQQGAAAWWAFRQADLYLSVSPALVTAAVSGGAPAAKVRLVPNGIDTTRFAPAGPSERADLRRRLGLPDGRPVVAFVGFFSADKQPRVLFDAWLRLRRAHGLDATLLFVGATTSAYFEVDPSIAERVRDDARREGVEDRVVFAGVTHDVPSYLRAADVFALPSRREGLPVALLEAMACGVPVVASHLPGATDAIIDDGVNGLLVEPGDVPAMAEAIASVVRDPARAAALGAAARATVRDRYADTGVADRWLTAYRDVLGEARP